MKKIIIATVVSTIALGGCANTNNMSREQQAGVGAGVGAGLGALIGYAIGGGKGAAIGAGAGLVAGGLAAYALASDPYTQSAAQQAKSWEKETGAAPEVVKVSEVTENGQTKKQIDVQKKQLSDAQMVSNSHLSPKIKDQLISARNEAQKTGGYVHVVCPANTPPSVISDIDSIGIGYSKDHTTQSGYTVLLARSRDELKTLQI